MLTIHCNSFNFKKRFRIGSFQADLSGCGKKDIYSIFGSVDLRPISVIMKRPAKVNCLGLPHCALSLVSLNSMRESKTHWTPGRESNDFLNNFFLGKSILHYIISTIDFFLKKGAIYSLAWFTY